MAEDDIYGNKARYERPKPRQDSFGKRNNGS